MNRTQVGDWIHELLWSFKVKACWRFYSVWAVPVFVSLQRSSGVESLRLTQASVQTPCLEDSEGRVRVPSQQISSTGSRCRSSSPSSCGPSRTPTVAMAPPTPRRRCRRPGAEPPSWASTASVSWLPASSSAPSSGPETSRISQNSPSQSRLDFYRWLKEVSVHDFWIKAPQVTLSSLLSRWRCWGWAGASCSSWTQLSPLCLCTWLRCWRPPASTRPPCPPSEWCPSWTRSGFSRTRWTSWTGCRWTRPSTAAWKPSHFSPPVSRDRKLPPASGFLTVTSDSRFDNVSAPGICWTDLWPQWEL